MTAKENNTLRAICDPHGNPHKGQKSYMTKWLERWYKNVTISKLAAGWVPNAVVLEGMFLVNTTPLDTHTTMQDYAFFFCNVLSCHTLLMVLRKCILSLTIQGDDQTLLKRLNECAGMQLMHFHQTKNVLIAVSLPGGVNI